MGKIFGILLIVAGIWVGLTIYTEGTDAAFGGLFGSGKTITADATGAPLPQHVRDSVGKAYQAQEARASGQDAE